MSCDTRTHQKISGQKIQVNQKVQKRVKNKINSKNESKSKKKTIEISKTNDNIDKVHTDFSVHEPTQNEKIKSNDLQKVVFSCNLENDFNELPIIGIKFGNFCVNALLDTGANLSLIESNILESIKNLTKIEYVSRMVKIQTLDKSSIPYMSAVNLKFKIQNKWFQNLFYVTKDNWHCNYQCILGYDFVQRNKILLDTVNQKLIIGNVQLDFQSASPHETDIIALDENNQNFSDKQINNLARVVSNITIQPGTSEVIPLKISADKINHDQILLIPTNKKQQLTTTESIHSLNKNEKYIHTIVENNTNEEIILRKKQIFGKIENFDNLDFVTPKKKQIYQVNNLNLKNVKELRKKEINKTDFNLDHLEKDQKEELLEFLMKNYQVFSKSYLTLGSTDAVIPEFKLLHNFPIQTKPYPIPKIAKQYAQQELRNFWKQKLLNHLVPITAFPYFLLKRNPYLMKTNKN